MGRYDILLQAQEKKPTQQPPERSTEPVKAPIATVQRIPVSPAPSSTPARASDSADTSVAVIPVSPPATRPPTIPSPKERFVLDGTLPADIKHSFTFTQDELEAIEDLKIELRRQYDIKTTKTEIVRCGIWELLEDYRRHGEKSSVFQQLKDQARK